MTVNMHEAKTQFSKLAKLVEDGEQVFIARNGKVIMKLVPLGPGELTEARDFSILDGKLGPISDDEWYAFKKEIADSVQENEGFGNDQQLPA